MFFRLCLALEVRYIQEREVVESIQLQMEEEAKVVEMLSEAYMGISTLKRGALEAREEEVWHWEKLLSVKQPNLCKMVKYELIC